MSVALLLHRDGGVFRRLHHHRTRVREFSKIVTPFSVRPPDRTKAVHAASRAVRLMCGRSASRSTLSRSKSFQSKKRVRPETAPKSDRDRVNSAGRTVAA